MLEFYIFYATMAAIYYLFSYDNTHTFPRLIVAIFWPIELSLWILASILVWMGEKNIRKLMK